MPTRLRILLTTILLVPLCPTVVNAVGPALTPGAEIYKTQCAYCHGPTGEGTKRYNQRLEGDLSVAQLAEVIRKTMPDGKPESLSVRQADAVAAFVHGHFYSRIARERNRVVRIELARLTVRQYRNAVADLIGEFRPAVSLTEKRGLEAEYFKNRRFAPNDRVAKRIDAQVAFDFGTDAPIPDKLAHHEFSIRWTGSLLAEQTGEYEIALRTEHATRLWLNDAKRPFIDAWVKSGKDTEFKANTFLVAGRAYPLRLEYSKAKQGVDDSKKQKKEPPRVKSSMSMLWKAPGRALSLIPTRNLLPTGSPEAYVCATPFPPDDRSYGWERGTTVSKEWDGATTEAALDAAGYVASRMDELAGTREKDPAREKKLLAFCHTFAERAFRRPLDEHQKKLIDRQFAAGKDPEMGVKRVVLVVLKSPHFLYREVSGHRDAYDVASRLSFSLWGSLPDRALLNAARDGKLGTREEVAAQAERLLSDVRGRLKLREFLLTWLKADDPHDYTRDARRFPGFDAALVADLRSSLELFLDEVVWSQKSDYRDLLLADEVHVNDRLAKFYGVTVPSDAGFRKVKLDEGKRAGVLSHPYLMASLTAGDESSPIHRGVFVARGLLGVTLKPPPDAVAPLAPDLHPRLNTRERVTLQTRPANCMTCHGVINQLGFALEHFDAVGRFRTKEKERDIDVSGAYLTRDGKRVAFAGSRELALFLADSPEAQSAFVEQLFHHLVQQSMAAYGPDTLDRLRRDFVANRFHVRKLAVDAVTLAAMKKTP